MTLPLKWARGEEIINTAPSKQHWIETGSLSTRI